MNNFAQALARIEELLKEIKSPDDRIWNKAHNELLHLCDHHADSIVQLAKVAANVTEALKRTNHEVLSAIWALDSQGHNTKPYTAAHSEGERAIASYDKLMTEEE